MADTQPQLPFGNPSTLQGISENFSFHASPESFITQRVLNFKAAHPDVVNSRSAIRAKILNRNVAIITSHSQILQVLDAELDPKQDPPFVATAAYDKLMGPFFPTPNVLLADGAAHAEMRGPWEGRVSPLFEKLQTFVERTAKDHFASLAASGRALDLYDSMKTLAWNVLLGAFLGLEPWDSEFAVIQDLQEDLLRGQFSLVPINVNLSFWQSPRSKGIDAKSKLQKLIMARLMSKDSSRCPFSNGNTDKDAFRELTDHTVLFTSSLAAKAFASLLTACLLNLFLFPSEQGQGCVPLLKGNQLADNPVLKSIVKETERLSPPIVGVMRRSTRENILRADKGGPDTLIPMGWDVWLYFVGGSRDPEAFGEDWYRFNPQRYLAADTQQSFGFGAGPKTCLGGNLLRDFACQIMSACLQTSVKMTGDVGAEGVLAWLGWSDDSDAGAGTWATDMKQLPTQHPAKPIMVTFSKTA